MVSKYVWQYYLVVPASAVAVADAVAPALSNPDGIESTFRRFPLRTEEGEYLEPASHWAASFLACDAAADGTPSREALESYLGQDSSLGALLWVRCKNPWHLDTTPSDRDLVVASNWPAIVPGSIANWDLLADAIANL
ncbi:hypothetical protein IQ273_31745 [Nodosilinea sp. LEGE 07298]|uniref:hypothetical protein n=1 Tax=Nodosilinea sp. LEGE 07298 TaxID=2777970 RepID=UPI0018806308|nr:hypothetical protein [Nodosilinea sp. LEGE 07298]MBE9113946.1 hypothetical protein [Nodosilinea sp. LEGE 07298]